MSKFVYVLLIDSDMTTFSQPKPFGVAVTDEEDAKKFVSECRYGADYEKLEVFDTYEQYKKKP